MAIITKAGNKQLTSNFNEREFRSGSWRKNYSDAPETFDLSDTTIQGVQAIRDYYNIPISINSTLRSSKHNTDIGGASRSQHLIGTAIDWRFSGHTTEGSRGWNAAIDYYKQVREKKGDLYSQLRSIGINGFGLYDSFNHIDSRTDSVAHWDNTTKKKSTVKINGKEPDNNIVTAYFDSWNGNDEDGLLDWERPILVVSIIVILIIIVLVWWFKFRKK